MNRYLIINILASGFCFFWLSLPLAADVYEAEDAELVGSLKVEDSVIGFSGTGYVAFFEEEKDACLFEIDIRETDFYDLNFISASDRGNYKENMVSLDGNTLGTVSIMSETFADSVYPRVYLEQGKHVVGYGKIWGWTNLDKLVVSKSPPLPDDIYNVSRELINPDASDNAKRLMSFLVDMYGKKILSGQYSHGFNGRECRAIRNVTGKTPALLGLDYLGQAGSQRTRGGKCNATELAVDFDRHGGIVMLVWHWGVPEKYRIADGGGFYIKETNIDLQKIMNGEDGEGLELILSDMDEIAEELKKLQEADVPVLWRPLHEASGAWFWWGAFGPDTFKKLWIMMYDRYTNRHKLNNLIWVWNGQGKDWYPGDEYVDIIGEDIYTGPRAYSSQMERFMKALNYTDMRKIIVLSENGSIFDPDLAVRDGAMWGFFATWFGNFVVKNRDAYSDQYTETEMLKKIYSHEAVLTLDELPDLKKYDSGFEKEK